MGGIIYLARNTINGKGYVGQTIQKFATRKWRHIYSAKNGSDTYFHNALRKHGFESFEWSILEQGKTIDELNLVEPEYIEKLSTLAPNGYNLTTGGKNKRYSEISKSKMRAAHLGHKVTDSTKKKLSIAFAGRKFTDETKKKISIANLGKKRTEVTKNKISAALVGKKRTNEYRYAKLAEKQVLQIRENLARGATQSALAKKYGVGKTAIHKIKNGSSWKYLLKEN